MPDNRDNRKALLQNIRNSLNSEGGFILCEKFLFSDQETTDYFQCIYEEWKQIYYTKGEISSKN